jgi:DNA-binding response OmpR family regulator
MTRILVVEDDPSIRMGLEDTLAAKGYEVDVVGKGGDGAERALTGRYDLVVLDVMLPDIDGFEVCRRIRASRNDARRVPVIMLSARGAERALTGRYDLVVLDVMLPDIDGFEVCRRIRASRNDARRVPVIMLSARGAELDRVRGLELGADDYVTKPFSLMELLARVASVLRRAHGNSPEPIGLAFGELDIDLVGQVATRAGKRFELPSRAFAILKVFARRPGEVVSRDVLLDEAWGYEDYPNTRTVDNHLVKLRKALEDEPERPRWLVTVHGAGYKLDVPRSAVRFEAR